MGGTCLKIISYTLVNSNITTDRFLQKYGNLVKLVFFSPFLEFKIGTVGRYGLLVCKIRGKSFQNVKVFPLVHG